jgi:hypothetical protein
MSLECLLCDLAKPDINDKGLCQECQYLINPEEIVESGGNQKKPKKHIKNNRCTICKKLEFGGPASQRCLCCQNDRCSNCGAIESCYPYKFISCAVENGGLFCCKWCRQHFLMAYCQPFRFDEAVNK